MCVNTADGLYRSFGDLQGWYVLVRVQWLPYKEERDRRFVINTQVMTFLDLDCPYTQELVKKEECLVYESMLVPTC